MKSLKTFEFGMVLAKTFVILKKIGYNGFMPQPFLDIIRMINIIEYSSICNKYHRPQRNSPKLKTQKIKDPKQRTHSKLSKAR